MSYIQKTVQSVQCLDSLNQRIWESGFDTFSLKELDNVVQEIENGTKVFERIPQEQQPGLSKGSSILTAAAIICRGCPRTRSEVRKIYDTDDLVGEGAIQERLVEIIIIHNALFPNTYLKVIGFGRNQNNEFVVLAEQPYCEGDVVSEQERCDFMHKLGFRDAGMDYGMHLNYCTSNLYVGDLNDYNVIKGQNCIHVIDADCRLNTPSLGCDGNYSIPETHIDFSKKCFLD